MQHFTLQRHDPHLSGDSAQHTGDEPHVRANIYPSSEPQLAAMAEGAAPLAACDKDQIAEIKPEDLIQQHRDEPATALDHSNHEAETEKTGQETARNSNGDGATSRNSNSTVKPKLEDVIRQHESTIKQLTRERDKLEKDASRNYRLLEAMRKSNDTLERQVRDLSLQSTEDKSQFRQQVATLAEEQRALEANISKAYQRGQKDGIRTQPAVNERVVLMQQVEAYKEEAAKWKQEAFGKGSEMFNTCWQASVDEAVRRKREPDNLAIEALRQEIAALKAEKRK